MTITQTTHSTDTVLALVIDRKSAGRIKANVQESIFDATHFAHVIIQRPPRVLVMPEMAKFALRSQLEWSESANMYADGIDYLALAVLGRPRISRSAGVTSVSDWLAIWNLDPSTSVQGEIEFAVREDATPYAPLEIIRTSGSRQYGATVEQIGPGRQ